MRRDRYRAGPPATHGPRARGTFSPGAGALGALFRAGTLFGAGALLGLGACAGVSRPEDSVQALLSRGDLTRAYWVLQDLVDANPEDAELRRQLAELRSAYYLREGQEKVFADDDWGAVEDFERVLLGDPGNIAATQWKQKALRKLAERAVVAGDDARARGKLEEALKQYHLAETYVPGHPEAARGTRLVSQVFTARREKGQDSYVKGMRAQAGGYFEQTQYHMQVALDNDPSLTAAEERSLVARRQLAEARLAQARVAEERGLYETALREYRRVATDFPDLAFDLEAKVVAMQREVDAGAKLSQGTLLARRGDFAAARPLLEQAYEASTAQRVRISEQLVALREADLDRRYTAALDLELDYRYDDALIAFRSIDANWPGQLDVRTRIQNLESALELAREAQIKGESAAAAGDIDAAISAYREALTYVPKFGDLATRIETLKQKVKPPADTSGSAPEATDKGKA